MMKLKIKLLAFQDAPQSVFRNAMVRVEKIIPHEEFEVTENDADILFFLTGGSERVAINQVSSDHFYVLIGSRHDNSYASATEVKAYLNTLNINSVLLDEEEEETRAFIRDYRKAKQALANLQGKRIGLIGKVSDWLVSSTIPADLLKSRLGLELVGIPWEKLAHFSDLEASGDFLQSFSQVSDRDLQATARVSTLLSDTVRDWKLDGITVECFPLVQEHGVTACLPLARFNDEGFPAGCEGDITAVIGMMLCRELTGIIPWIANINKVKGDICLFSHCTIAPGLVSDYTVTTHFETGKGTAIAGKFKGDEVTIFRFDNNLSHAFIALAGVIGRPQSETACRTQIEVKLAEHEADLLRQRPLGNHHLIFPGDCSKLLKTVCLLLGIEVLK